MRKKVAKVAIYLILGLIVNITVAWSCAYYFGAGDELFHPDVAQNIWHIKKQDYRGTVHSFSGFGSISWSLSMNAPYPEQKWIETDESDIFQWWSRLKIPNKHVDRSKFAYVLTDISIHEQAQGWPFLTVHCDWMTTMVDMRGPRYSSSDVYARRDSLKGGIDLRVLFEPEPEPVPDPDPETFHDPRPEPDARRGWFPDTFFQNSTILPFHPIWTGLLINSLFYGFIIWGVVSAPGAMRREFRKRRNRCPDCGYPIGTSAICTECGYQLVKSNT